MLFFACNVEDIETPVPENHQTEEIAPRSVIQSPERSKEIRETFRQFEQFDANIIREQPLNNRYLAYKSNGLTAPKLERFDVGIRSRFQIVSSHYPDCFSIIPLHKPWKVLGPDKNTNARVSFRDAEDFGLSNVSVLWRFYDPLSLGICRIRNAYPIYYGNSAKYLDGYLRRDPSASDDNALRLTNLINDNYQQWRIKPLGTFYIRDVEYVAFEDILLTTEYMRINYLDVENNSPTPITRVFQQKELSTVTHTFQ